MIPGKEQAPDDLQAAVADGKVFIRVIGRGSFKISPILKTFIADVCEKAGVNVVVIDMSECVFLDSTFMGVLAGLSGRLRQQNRTLELINLSEKNRRLLETLGVDRVLSHYSDAHGRSADAQAVRPLPAGEAGKKELARTALQAHEELVRLCEENRARFTRVIEYLKADVDRMD